MQSLCARLALLAMTLCAATAHAGSTASIRLSTDKSLYDIGDPIVVSVLGIPAPGQIATQVFARVLFSDGGQLASFVSSSQVGLTLFGGVLPWSTGVLTHGPGFADALNQVGPICVGPKENPVEGPVVAAFASAQAVAVSQIAAIDAPAMATIVMQAVAPGVVTVAFDLRPGPSRLDFFGVSMPEAIRFTIIPEPSPLWLLSLGLATLTHRRR